MNGDEVPQAEEVGWFRKCALFTSVEPLQNRRRLYRLSWQPSPWDGGALIGSWAA